MFSASGARKFDRERTLPLVLSTDDVREHERFAYWREMTCQAFLDLRPERTARDRTARASFFGSIRAGGLGAHMLAHVHSDAQHVHRTRTEIAKSPRAMYFVNLQLEGESTLRQGELAALRVGDFALVDATRPFELGFRGPFRQVSIEVPHHVLAPRLADPARAPGLVVRGDAGLGGLVSGYLRAVAAMATTPEHALLANEALGDNVVELLAIALGATAEARRRATPSLEEARRRAVFAYVERNLADPALSPAHIARALAISTRYLHKLFERSDVSLMQWVVARRLERCRADLTDPAKRDRTIADIAFAWGFADLSHFGRAFKAAFGESPRARRRADD